MSTYWWRVKDLNLRRQSRGIYSPLPLAARATRQGRTSTAAIMDSAKGKDTLGTCAHKPRFQPVKEPTPWQQIAVST